MSKQLVAVDLFCGAGGFSEGLKQACDDLGYELLEAAVNHWDRAVETHELNHPAAHQYHSKVEQLHPPEVIQTLTGDAEAMPDVDLLVGGPECTHFSKARGGKPVSEQKRMSPWHVLDWLEKLNVDSFIIENVSELRKWGPVDDEGNASLDGSVFDAWVTALNALGYAVDWTQLTAADYGDPTSRERFFIIGRKHGTVTFPEPTHGTEPDKPARRTAADIIDWSDLGTSIWTRDVEHARYTPPAATTMERIAEGLRRHGGPLLDAYADAVASVDPDTLRSLRSRVVDAADAATVAAAIDEPFLVRVEGGRSAQPWLLKYKNNSPAQPTDAPLDTIHAAGNHYALATPETHLLRQQNGDGCHPVPVDRRACPTVAKAGAHAIYTARPLVMPKNGLQGGPHSNTLYEPGTQPFHTVTSDPRAKLVTPVVTPFVDDYEGAPKAVDNALGTVTTRDKFALCLPALYPWGLDIQYRMLQPPELKQAQGFPADYDLTGTKADRKEQIGNAVPVHLAKALCKHVLTAEDPSLGTYGGGLAETDASVPDYDEVVGDD